MEQTDKELFGKALLEGMTNKYTKEMAACRESDSCSRVHLRKISRIIGVNVQGDAGKERQRKKAWIAVILAAALLLSTITVVAYHDRIGGFIRTVYEKFIHVTHDSEGTENTPETITEIYTLSYVPEGYVLKEESVRPKTVSYKWENESGDWISFEQCVYDATSFGLDNEKGETAVLTHGSYEILHSTYELTSHYLWNNETYTMSLIVTGEFTEDEILKMVQGAEKIKK